MKITPMVSPQSAVPGPADPQVGRIQGIRSLRMSTNASPEVFTPPPETPAAPELTTSDLGSAETDGALEEAKPLSAQAAALARQRRDLHKKLQEVESLKKSLEGKPAGIDLERIKKDPLSVLLDAGVTYDQLTEAILARQQGSAVPEIQALKAEIEALKANVDKTFADKDTEAKKQALSEMKREATLLSSEGDDFAMVRETGSIPLVLDLIERTFDTSGEVLDVQEALKLVEDELVERNLRLAKIQKVQSLLKPAEPAPSQMPQQPQTRQMRTLTNRDTAQVQVSAKQRAIQAFYGQLNKR